jgi:hypothetical protein
LSDFTSLEKIVITGNPYLGEMKNKKEGVDVIGSKQTREQAEKKSITSTHSPSFRSTASSVTAKKK